jgi:hypothetical protein
MSNSITLDLSKKLHINLDNIHELNHSVYTHSLKTKSVGKEYNTLFFGKKEEMTDSDPWMYTINKHGYRGSNWSMNRNVVAFFGCSITFGIGVEKDIASVVQQKTNKECINMGQPGASALTVLKTFSTFVKHYPVDTAVITLPSLRRVYYPTYYKKYNAERWNYESLLPHWVNDHHKDLHEIAFKFFDEDVCSAYLYDYVQMAETVAAISNTKIVWSSWDRDTLEFLNSVVDSQNTIPVGDLSVDIARDNLHPGPKFVENWSNIIIDKL